MVNDLSRRELLKIGVAATGLGAILNAVKEAFGQDYYPSSKFKQIVGPRINSGNVIPTPQGGYRTRTDEIQGVIYDAEWIPGQNGKSDNYIIRIKKRGENERVLTLDNSQFGQNFLDFENAFDKINQYLTGNLEEKDI